MRSSLTKVGLALILSLTTALSSNLGAVELEIDKPTKEGYFYIPPKSAKTFDQLSQEEQKKVEEFGFDRKKFSDYLLKRQAVRNETNTTNTTNTKK